MSGATIINKIASRSLGRKPQAIVGRRLAERIDIVAQDSIASLEGIWRQLENEGNASVYQRYDWIDICLRTINSSDDVQPYIIYGSIDGFPAFIFPMIIEGSYIKVLKWIGGSHSNYNMPLFSNKFMELHSQRDIEMVFKRIIRMLPGVTLVKLCNQPLNWEGIPNPFLHLPHITSTNPAFDMSLEGGLEGVLSRGNRKRKKKKFNSQVRFCEPYGGYRLVMPKSEAEALSIMEVFKQQKAHRFKMLGIKNVFGSKEAQAFLDDLARHSVNDNPIVRLFGLEIAGELRAIYGGGISGTRFSGYFSSISDDEFTQMSPGEMLLYLLVDECAKVGFSNIDLGAGDERYKRSWCPERIDLFDTIVPVKWQAHPIVKLQATKHRLRRRVRSSNLAWESVKRLRKIKGGLAMKLTRDK